MLKAVAVQKELIILRENRYFDRIQDSVRRDSAGVRAFRVVWGLDQHRCAYQSSGVAALTLYRLTAAMFCELIPEKHRDVINTTLRLIKEARCS